MERKLIKSGQIKVLKNNVKFNLELVDDDYFEITSFVKDNKVGFCNFKIIHKENMCFLNYIEMTDETYEHQGIASTMLKIMESFASKRGCYMVNGKFYPKKAGTEPFYEKNGYTISNEGYGKEIFKNIMFIDELNF